MRPTSPSPPAGAWHGKLVLVWAVAAVLTAGGCPSPEPTTPVQTLSVVPADALTVAQAKEAPLETPLRVVAFLVEHGEDCHCPPDVPCSPCRAPYARFADQPIVEPLAPILQADMAVDRAELPVGKRYVLTGRWVASVEAEPGLFMVESIGRVE